MKEYKTAKGTAFFIYLSSSMVIILFVWLLILPFQNGDFTPNKSWLLIPISVAVIVLMTITVIDAYKFRLIIQQDCITTIGTFSNQELKFIEIKGFAVGKYHIFIESNNKEKKRLNISKNIGGYDEIFHWLSQNFPNLDLQNTTVEEQKNLNQLTAGTNDEV